jgi:hypothetical protein
MSARLSEKVQAYVTVITDSSIRRYGDKKISHASQKGLQAKLALRSARNQTGIYCVTQRVKVVSLVTCPSALASPSTSVFSDVSQVR